MPTLKVSGRQIISLIDQLSDDEKIQVLIRLLFESDTHFASSCKIGEQAFKKICQARNLYPDKMTEDEKLSLIDEILHESGP